MNKNISCYLVNFRGQKISTLFLLLFVAFICHAQQIPNRPSPPRLVNDFTNTLTASQRNNLEYKLRAYNDTTSTQIAVVFINDLQGTTAADFAYQIGEKWGVGTKENNGIVILVKPKNKTKGEVFISVGYGLEQYIPDALAKRIIENQMIPAFKYNDYYTGVNNAIDSIIKLASGGFSSDENHNESSKLAALIIIIIGMAAMILYIGFANRISTTISSKKDDSSFWRTLFWLSLLNNSTHRHHHHDHWNGFSGGSGGFGGGGFSGFGGGSFGGGGAGGSW
jgi:uncharacterized protein